MFFVIEDDEHNSLASIARNGAGGKSLAEGEQLTRMICATPSASGCRLIRNLAILARL